MAKDEKYVIDLCDKILGVAALRNHRFDFLLGDPSKTGRRARLPVDAYYPTFKLVVEYQERQHTEAVPFFDRRIVASGITRGEQRKIYDARRREVLPKHGITLVELSFHEFKHDKSKRLLRDASDHDVIQRRLSAFLH